EHKVNKARKISQDEATAIIKAADDRGHVHTAWFRDALGDRLYCICNCCKCCWVPMKAHSNHVPIIAPSGYVADINEECNGCSACVSYCQFEAISIVDDHALVNLEKCMGCGVCESKCANEAITLKRDPNRCEPLDLRIIMEHFKSTNG